MSDEIARAIVAPYAVLDASFADALAAAAPGAPPVHVAGAWVRSVKAHFAGLLPTEEALARVPLLTADALRRGAVAPNSLVRVVGQVQDSFDVELYPAVVPAPSGPGQLEGRGAVTYCAFRDTVSEAQQLPAGADFARSLMSRCVRGRAARWRQRSRRCARQ